MNILFFQLSPCIRNYKLACVLGKQGIRITQGYIRKPLSQMYPGLSDQAYAETLHLPTPAALAGAAPRYDLIHCHNPPDMLVLTALATGRPVVHDSHDITSLLHPGDRSTALFEELANRRAHGRVYVSDQELEEARRLYDVDPEFSVVVPNLPVAAMLPARRLEKLSAADGGVHLVYEGGVTLQPDTIRSFMPLLTRLAECGFHVHIHPDHHNSDPAIKQAVASNPRMHWYPSLPPEELLTTLTRYDFGLIPFAVPAQSRRHMDAALPNKLFEYLAAGLPVASVELYSVRRFLEQHEAGLIFNSAEDLQAKIKTYRQTRELPVYTMEKAVAPLIDLYAKLIAEARP